MKTWVNFVDELDTEFDPALHCVDGGDVSLWTMEEAEGGEGASVSVERKQRGWRVLGGGQPKAILIVESPTGLSSEAFVRARVLISQAPSDLFSTKQVLTGRCAPEDIADRILDFAKANLASGPETDFLFSDAEPDDAESYLLGRSATYHIDATTHEVSLNPILDGERVLDLTPYVSFKTNPPTDGPIEGNGPARKILAELEVPFTQSAHGVCNIGPMMGHISTMTPDFFTNMGRDVPGGTMVDHRAGAGWSFTDRSQIEVKAWKTEWFFSGRIVKARYKWTYQRVGFPMHGATYLQDRLHRQFIRMLAATLKFWGFFMQYDMDQEREEKAYFELDVPVQSSAVTNEASEVLTFSLKDLFEDTSAEPHDPLRSYDMGEKVLQGGRFYIATRNVPAGTLFYAKLPNQSLFGPRRRDENAHPYWKEVPSEAAAQHGINSFLDTDRGLQVKQHVLCRMRKEAHLRLRARSITMTIPYEAAPSISLKDEVKLMVPFGDTDLAPVVGKVTSIRRNFPSMKQPTIELTIAVPFGDGSDDVVEPVEQPVAAYDFFLEDYVIPAPDTYNCGDDIVWSQEADPVPREIIVSELSNPAYSVKHMLRWNDYTMQYQRVMGAVFAHNDPRQAVADNPTRVFVEMRDLFVESVLHREIDIQATLLRSKRGVDLTAGGEP